MERRRYTIRGRVQGVGYRIWAAREARRRELVGYVRNLADGSVEVEAGGDSTVLREFEAALRRGPRLAEVADVVSESVSGSFTPADFLIRH
jgi:acylphosphatase